jgi:hypothetical protein
MKRLAKKWIFVYVVLSFLASCVPNSSQDDAKSPTSVAAAIQLSEISSGSCLNIEKLMARIQNPLFQYPVQLVVTNMVPLTPMPESLIEFFSYVTFRYLRYGSDHARIFPQVRQADCQNVEVMTASHNILNFKIIESSPRHLKFQFVNQFADSVAGDLQKALWARNQPYEYSLDYVSESSVNYTERYRTIDPTCQKNAIVDLMVYKNLTWSEADANLPDHFQIVPSYLEKTLLAEQATATDLQMLGLLSVVEIQAFMAQPLRQDIVTCQ